MKERKAEYYRKTAETDIEVKINLDGKGISTVKTGVGFLDHMLTLFSKHGLIDLDVKAEGDLWVDDHHTVEDVGISIGKAVEKALGSKAGIKRYGTAYTPMDEALARAALDISGRPFLVFNGNLTADKVGSMDTELFEEFFRALAFNSGITLHLEVLYGKNTHHMIEALFKALGRALREAIEVDERIEGVMSTKGTL